MPDQVSYYDSFGSQFEQDILECPEPALWTTDYQSKGRIYQELKERVEMQKKIFQSYLTKQEPVLDIGCGFGRQAMLLAAEGFNVTGIDTSTNFISIAKKLFNKFQYKGNFIQTDLLSGNIIGKKFSQVILLDVLEHIAPRFRKAFVNKITELSLPGTVLIISLPRVRPRLLSQLNNRFRKAITQHIGYFFTKEEHPYPIPGKNEILHLTKDRFLLKNFESTRDTDFYVLSRHLSAQ